MSDLTKQRDEELKKRLEYDKALRNLYGKSGAGEVDTYELDALKEQALGDPTAALSEEEFDARSNQLKQNQGSVANLLKQEFAKQIMGAVGKAKTTNKDVLSGIYGKGFNMGLDEDQVDDFLGKKGVSVYDSPEDQMIAQQKQTAEVTLRRGGGDLLGASKAMQDPDYVLGSGSSLNQPARSLSTRSGELRKSARRLRKQGYSQASEIMAAESEKARMNEPRIRSEAQRNRNAILDTEIDLAGLQDRKEAGLFDRYIEKSRNRF